MKYSRKSIVGVIEAALLPDARGAVEFLSQTQIVRATKRLADRSKVELVVTLGKPNYAERAVIKRHKKAGGLRFPIFQTKFKKLKKKAR